MAAGRVVVVGSINLDATLDVERLPAEGETLLAAGIRMTLGGKGANQAIAAARLTEGGRAPRLVGALGDDGAGATLRSLLAAEDVDLSGVRDVAGLASGQAFITVDRAGANTIVVVPGANGALRPDDVSVDGAGVVLTQLEIPVATVDAALTRGRECGAITILNPAPAQHLPDEVLGAADIIVPNEHEAAELTGIADPAAAAGAIRARAPGATVIVTCGKDGAVVVGPAGVTAIAAHCVTAVDTVAAGDAFCGALAAALAAGRSLDDAVRRAMAAGAHAVTVLGASPSLPRLADVDRILGRA